MMKKAVHFGAGKIGRGFIAELLHDSGFEIVFGDVVDALVDIVNKDHEYPLFLIDHDYQEKIIDHVIAYSQDRSPSDPGSEEETGAGRQQGHCYGLRECHHGYRYPEEGYDRNRYPHC